MSSFLYNQLKIGILVLILFTGSFATCKYSFNDTSYPAEVKTFRVNYLDNKAAYVNAQLSPLMTEKLRQKIINTTRLKQTGSDEAHYDISGYISQYSISTISISGNNSSGNRLSVGFHLIFKNNLDEKKNQEADVIRSYDFDANISLSQAESNLNSKIVSDLTDDVFNKIFSNW